MAKACVQDQEHCVRYRCREAQVRRERRLRWRQVCRRVARHIPKLVHPVLQFRKKFKRAIQRRRVRKV